MAFPSACSPEALSRQPTSQIWSADVFCLFVVLTVLNLLPTFKKIRFLIKIQNSDFSWKVGSSGHAGPAFPHGNNQWSCVVMGWTLGEHVLCGWPQTPLPLFISHTQPLSLRCITCLGPQLQASEFAYQASGERTPPLDPKSGPMALTMTLLSSPSREESQSVNYCLVIWKKILLLEPLFSSLNFQSLAPPSNTTCHVLASAWHWRKNTKKANRILSVLWEGGGCNGPASASASEQILSALVNQWGRTIHRY